MAESHDITLPTPPLTEGQKQFNASARVWADKSIAADRRGTGVAKVYAEDQMIKKDLEEARIEKARNESRFIRLEGKDYVDAKQAYELYSATTPIFLMFTIGEGDKEERWGIFRQTPQDGGSDRADQPTPVLKIAQLIPQADGEKYKFDTYTGRELSKGKTEKIKHVVGKNGVISEVILSIDDSGNLLHMTPDGRATLKVGADEEAQLHPGKDNDI
jgi:hypothetical protein